jgi:cytochrome c556
MKPITAALALGLVLTGSFAFAKAGVKDPGVKARERKMEAIALNLKLLAHMADGKMDFNADDAGTAKASILAAVKRIPALFKPHDTDPKSDALPVIWAQWDDFTKKAGAARMAVELIDTDTQDGLQISLRGIGKACKACHETYRK